MTEHQEAGLATLREVAENFLRNVQGGKWGAPTIELLSFCGQVHSLLENMPKTED
jgi:hypothetical protein